MGGSDHDYTRARTPPKGEKMKSPKTTNKFTTPKPRGKENRAMQIKRETEEKRKSAPQLPSKSPLVSTFKPRNQMEEYNVLYSFLIRGKEKLIKRITLFCIFYITVL